MTRRIADTRKRKLDMELEIKPKNDTRKRKLDMELEIKPKNDQDTSMRLITLHLICLESLYIYQALTYERDGLATIPSKCICYPPTWCIGFDASSNK